MVRLLTCTCALWMMLNEMSVLEPGIIGKLNDRKAGLKKIDMVLKEALADKSKAKDVEAKIPFAPTLDQSSKYLILDLIKDIISYAGYSSTEKRGLRHTMLKLE